MKTFDDSLDAVRWLGMTETVGSMFAFPVDLVGAGQALVRIQEVMKSGGHAADLADAFSKFQACVGPAFLAELIYSDDMRQLCPSSKAHDDYVVLWADGSGKKVVARDAKPYWSFTVEAVDG